ncbi:unnamed protein product [Rhizoctonia solani]|uniref:Uncharacterized protein n=1 Tax=Rhizoctonia solani TaxID=456999 RepID=A0A8H3CFR3_9AGAM|nr:unnamed protein product [Rhizoctonia solani]
MVSKLTLSRLTTTIDAFKAKLAKFRAPAPQEYRDSSSAVERSQSYAVADESHHLPDFSCTQTQQAVNDVRDGCMKTSDMILPVFGVTTIDPYNCYWSEPSSIYDSIDTSTYTIRSGSVPVSRVPTITTEHPAMHIVPVSVVVDI